MTQPPELPPTKGMAMIASYRAARLTQRPALRTQLRDSRVALRRTRDLRTAVADSAPAPEPEPTLPEPPREAAPPQASIFADLVSAALVTSALGASAAPPAPEPEPEPTAPPVSAAPPPLPESSVPPDPPLAEIGFGPGMLIRLSQLGLHTIGDLAQADAQHLRASLGDISRLVDVDTWITHARKAATSPT